MNLKNFYIFKTWILWRWVVNNFSLSDIFINNFKKIVNKLDYKLTANEQKFIFDIEELVFAIWRPLKELPVKFDLVKNEQINFMQSKVNWHILIAKNDKENPEFFGLLNMYYSKKNIYLTDDKQIIKHIIPIHKISNFESKSYGTTLFWDNQKYLVRGHNKMLTYIILNRIINNNTNILNKYPNIIGNFELFYKFLKKFN
ncbi:hypothetical protein [Spiroplasma endosymbiont of Labia minor]|uniref:hypothetical protein n=1 Tax=Spiroplasma endosymbiont of Labia minor TaxID=3066305 RepID=UPI0030D5B8DE